MRRLCVVLFCVCVGGLLPARAAQEGVPRVVRFDGQAPAGAAAGAHTATLAVFDAATDGALLWQETQVVQVAADGRFAVLVGAGHADGLPPAVLASSDPRWLDVRFDGEPAMARALLTSVPYALRAADADTLGGLPASAFLRVPERAGAHRDGAPDASASGDLDRPAVNTGTTGYIGKFTNAIDLTSSVMFEGSGRIGVGTGATTPLDTLHVRFADAGGSVTGYAVQNMSGAANAYSGMLFYDQNGTLGQFQGFNNTTHEYRINNIAAGGSINFMIGGQSRFLVRNDGDIQLSGNVRKGADFWMHELGGGQNTAVGRQALAAISLSGATNTAVGYQAMQSADSAGGNTAVGKGTLRLNLAGQQNVAIGYDALRSLDDSYNIAIGAFAGADKVSGNRNIYIGQGVGSFFGNSESDTIRIGDFSGNYSRFFAGGIRGVTTGLSNAVTVMIDANGQLGTVNSSRRYKEDIRDMGDASSGLMRLRPVTYRYTQAYADGSRPLDYGLIAEEVAEVYPDLVAHLQNGEIETVQYHKVNAMLLNEVQKQHRRIEELTERLATLERLLTSTPK